MKIESVEKLTVVHENCYSAVIDKQEIISLFEDDTMIKITIKNDYRYEDGEFPGLASMASTEPFDKDEITSIILQNQNGEYRNLPIPFKDVSPNSAYCINAKSEKMEDENSITIVWKKYQEEQSSSQNMAQISREVKVASEIFQNGEQIEIVAECPFKGLKGILVFVSEESLDIEVLIEYEEFTGCESYFKGKASDIKYLIS